MTGLPSRPFGLGKKKKRKKESPCSSAPKFSGSSLPGTSLAYKDAIFHSLRQVHLLRGSMRMMLVLLPSWPAAAGLGLRKSLSLSGEDWILDGKRELRPEGKAFIRHTFGNSRTLWIGVACCSPGSSVLPATLGSGQRQASRAHSPGVFVRRLCRSSLRHHIRFSNLVLRPLG